LEEKISYLEDNEIKKEYVKSLDNLKRELREESFIRSNENGVVSELYIKNGQFVEKGEEILKLSKRGQNVKDLVGVFYFPIEQGRKIIPGMSVKIDLVNISKEEYGYLLGRVERVSNFPINSQSIQEFTNIEQLGNNFADKIVLEVIVDLIPSTDTYTGFVWTTDKGPPIIIQPGNIAIGNCIIKKIKPIQLIFPNL
jgi:NHLM bacteriocin system secretion protein